MGYKLVCLPCRKVWNYNPYLRKYTFIYICAHCCKPYLRVSHRFRPPKKENHKDWAVVEYLMKNGFFYQHIYEKAENGKRWGPFVKYPESLIDAKIFVKKYRNQQVEQWPWQRS